MQTNSANPLSGSTQQASNQSTDGLSSSAGKTLNQGIPHSQMVPIPMASSSGGTDYADYKDFYKYQQQQQKNIVQTNNTPSIQSNTQTAVSNEQNYQYSQNIHQQTTPLREKEFANQNNNSQNGNKQYNNQYEMGGNPHFQKNDDNTLQNQNQNEQQHQSILQQTSNIPTQDIANAGINQPQFQRNQFQNNEQQNYENNQLNRQQFQQNQQQPAQQVNQKQNGQITSTPLQQKHIIPQQQQQQEEVEEENLVGVIKIKDGLFICDEYGAQDLEFIISNKVSKIVNTAGMQLNNHWDNIGVQYLTLNWQDDEKQVLFDEAEKIPDEIYNFMNDGLENHESVLIKSEKAQNRACFVICAFIMRKYRWSMLKTLEFINSRRQDLEMRPAFLKQLQMYENKLFKRGLGPKTQRWTEIYEVNDPVKNEELILRNTYLNSQQGPWAEFSKMPVANTPNQEQTDLKQACLSNPKVLKWRDEINAPFSQINHQQVQGSNNKQNAGPLSFMCGSAPQILGASLKTNNPQSLNGPQKLAICFEYSKENDLLQQIQTQKQQNHIIFNKDSIQMKRNVTPILRKKMKPIQNIQSNQQSLSASKNIMQIPITTQAAQTSILTINNSQGNKENTLANLSQINGQNNILNQQNKNIQNIGKINEQVVNQQRIVQQEQYRGPNNEAIQYMGQINQKADDNMQNVRASVQINDSQAQQFNNFNFNHPNFGGQFGKASGSISGPQPQINNFINQSNTQQSQVVNSEQYLQQQQTQGNKELKNGHKSAQAQEIQTGVTPLQQRSSSTRIKPNSASQSHSQSASTQNAVKSTQRVTSSLQGREETNNTLNQQSANSSSAQRLAKLTSQNISQPRRREPTSRVAPKNQISSNSQGQIISSNNTNIDTSILSTSMNNGNSINNGTQQNQNISSAQKTNQARLNSNRQSQQQTSSNNIIGGSQVSANIPTGQTASNANNQGVHPSKKQQLRYQQQLNGRGYSPSYNNLMKDQNGQPYQQQPNSKSSTQNTQSSQQNKSGKSYGNSGASQHQTMIGHSGSSHTPTQINGVSTNSQKKQINNTNQNNTMGQQRPGSAPKQISQQQHHHNTSSVTNAQNNAQAGIPSPNHTNNNYARNTQQQMNQINKNNQQTGSISQQQNNQSLSSQNNVRASMQQQQIKQQSNGYIAGSISSQSNNNQAFQQKQSQAPSSAHHMMHTSATVGTINSQAQAPHQQPNNQAIRGNSGVRVAPSTTHHQLLSNNNSMVIRNSNSLSSIQQKNLQQQNHNAQPSPKNINNEPQNINQLDPNQQQYSNQGTSNGQQNASKSILSSFRNGPIKILGANSSTSQLGISFSEGQSKQMQHLQQYNNTGNNMISNINQNQVHQHQIQNSTAFNRIGMNQQPQNMSQIDGRIEQQQQNNLQFRQAKSSQMVSSGSDSIPGIIGQSQSQMNGALRPASAPSNKRPPSPGQLVTQSQSAAIQQHQQVQPINPQLMNNQIQNQQAYYQQQQQLNNSQQQNRVKYPKQLINENQISNSGYAVKQMQPLSSQTNNGIQMSNSISQSGNHKLIAQNNTYQVNRPSSSNSAIGSSRGIVSASIQQQQLIQQQQAHHQGPHLSAQQPGIGNGNHNATSYIQQQQNVFVNNGNQQNANQIKSSQQNRMFQQASQNAYIHQAPHHFGPSIQQMPISPGGGLQTQNVGYNMHTNKTQTSINTNSISNSAFQNKH